MVDEISELRSIAKTMGLQCEALERELARHPGQQGQIQLFLSGHISDLQSIDEYIAHRTAGGFSSSDSVPLELARVRRDSIEQFLASLNGASANHA